MKLSSERNETVAEINVVPLVDIVLVILIIFMVSAPLFIKPSLSVQLPEAGTAQEVQKSKPVTITIDAEGHLDFNGDLISLEDLVVKMGERLKAQPDLAVVIAADKRVAHGAVVTVLDKIQALGVKKFALNVEAR